MRDLPQAVVGDAIETGERDQIVLGHAVDPFLLIPFSSVQEDLDTPFQAEDLTHRAECLIHQVFVRLALEPSLYPLRLVILVAILHAADQRQRVSRQAVQPAHAHEVVPELLVRYIVRLGLRRPFDHLPQRGEIPAQVA